MNKTSNLSELKTFSSSLVAIAFASVSVLPMIVLGWLVSAIARNPAANEALQGEAVYEVISIWKGGMVSLPPLILLMCLLIAGMVVGYLFIRRGISEAGDGMGRARIVTQKLLLPMGLSSTGFMSGIIGNATFVSLACSLVVYIGFACVAGFVHYVIDTTSPSKSPQKKA